MRSPELVIPTGAGCFAEGEVSCGVEEPCVVSGTIQICEVFLFAARSTSTAANSTHLPSGEGTGSPTRFSFIMSSKVKGCFAWENAGREKRRTKRKARRRMGGLRGTGKCSRKSKVRSQIEEVNRLPDCR